MSMHKNAWSWGMACRLTPLRSVHRCWELPGTPQPSEITAAVTEANIGSGRVAPAEASALYSGGE